MSIPEPTERNVSAHVRNSHGYDVAYAAAQHPKVLLDEHKRIHQELEAHRLNHTHSDPNNQQKETE